MDEMAAQGTTTVEAKSGYGLSFAAEMKSLEAIREASHQWAGTVVPTLLGAHVIAPEYRDNPEEYVPHYLRGDDSGCRKKQVPRLAPARAAKPEARKRRAGARSG